VFTRYRLPRDNQGERRATIRMSGAVSPGAQTSSGGRSGWVQHLILHHEKDQHLPGRHITDCQTRLYMKSRQTFPPSLPRRPGSSTATAYRIAAWTPPSRLACRCVG
jgi:hypothetical protein